MLFREAVHSHARRPITRACCPSCCALMSLQLGRWRRSSTPRVLSGYADAIVMRVFSHKMLEEVSQAATVPVTNALSDDHHPCLALAEALTIRENFGTLDGIALAYCGDANNVAHSLMEVGAVMGMHIAVACPPGYRPDPEIESRAADMAAESGGSIHVVGDPYDAVRGADVVYSDVFVSMGDDADAAERQRIFGSYQVTADLMAAAKPCAIFMHCLPAHRDEEVAADVIDGLQSVVFQQAANRLPTEQALLYALRKRNPGGASAEQTEGLVPRHDHSPHRSGPPR